MMLKVVQVIAAIAVFGSVVTGAFLHASFERVGKVIRPFAWNSK